MPWPQNFVQNFHTLLGTYAGLSSFPISLLLIGLKEFIDQMFSCPCTHWWSLCLLIGIFIGPFVFTFALMVYLLRPCKYRCFLCSAENNQKNCCFKFIHCLIPPVTWIIILFLDGDYLACGMTKWEGNYVSDEEINRKWCKPIQPALTVNESDLRLEYQTFIWESQLISFGMIAFLSALTLVILCVYDCCNKAQGSAQGRAEDGTLGEADGDRHSRSEGGAQGRAEGGAQGRTQGGAQGRTQGGAQGRAEGGAQGRAEGGAQGRAEGGAQGRTQGGALGEAEGDRHDMSEGDAQGKADSGEQGRSEGGGHGRSEGGTQSEAEGNRYGRSEGDAQGRSESGTQGKAESSAQGWSETFPVPHAPQDGTEGWEQDDQL